MKITTCCVTALLLLSSCNRTPVDTTQSERVSHDSGEPRIQSIEQRQRDDKLQREIAEHQHQVNMEAQRWETERKLIEMRAETEKKIRQLELEEKLDEIHDKYRHHDPVPSPSN